MQLISEEYRELNRLLHEQRGDYGCAEGKRLHNVARRVRQFLDDYSPTTVLDYGCGKGVLSKALPKYAWSEYDPCVPGKDTMPQAADAVVCVDVLEHVERVYVENVLAHLSELATKVVFLTIGLRPSNKELPDGRNTHITLLSVEEWLRLVGDHFKVVLHWAGGGREGQLGKLFIIGESLDAGA